MAIRSERTFKAWINSEQRECVLTLFDDNTCSVTFGGYEEIAIWLKDNYWHIDYFFMSVRAYSATIIAYADELAMEHILTLIQMTYEMANYGEVKFEYD